MAAVYRATYRLNGETVALKLVSDERFGSAEDPTSESFNLRLALLREFQTLASLHHPNIVEVLGYGVHEGRAPYFTMEILQQPRDIVQAAEGRPLSFKLDLLVQLLRALTYVHRRGILHRDIKPSNVLCVGDQVKVLDFGIAVAAGKIENIAGTIDYMAPEILLGHPPSVQSDLYAVGVLAYQVLTGQHPHNKKSQTGFLRSLLNTDSDITISGNVADLLSGRSSTIPKNQSFSAEDQSPLTLDALTGRVGDVVRKLLSPNPEDRYGEAVAVVQALATATQEPMLAETAATRESFLQASEMVGRQSELSQLSQALDRARSGSGSGWLLGGESGVGKSRLTSEIRTLAMVSGAVVAQGQAVTESSSHYLLWLPVLRVLCLHVELSDADAAVLKELIPDLPNLLGRAIPEAPKVQPEFAEKRLSGVIESLFRQPARPVVVLLEDLQWAGPDCLTLLSRLAEIAHELPLLIVANYRDDESPELPRRLPQMNLLRLRRLGHDAIAQLSTSMLGETGRQPWVIDYLSRQTEGNVFFIVEVARALAEQAGQLEDIAKSSLPEQIFTLGIGRIVERRLDRLPDQYRPVLEAAATIGRKLDLAVLQHLFASFDLRTFLMVCANVAILESGEGEWRFVHDKLREGLLGRLTAAQRQGLHVQVAFALEHLYPSVESYTAILAYHFRQGGMPDKASVCYLRAGESASRLCAYDDARRHFAGALESLHQLPETEEIKRTKVDTLLKQVRAAHIADGPKKNLERLGEATELLQSLTGEAMSYADVIRLAWVYYWCGRIHYYRGESRESVRYCQQVLRRAKEHDHAELLVLASAATGTAMFDQGRVDLGLPLLESTLDTFAAMGCGHEWVRAIGHHGLCLIGLGQFERGMADVLRAHARAQEIGKPMIIAMTNIYHCMGSMHTGDWPLMLSGAQRCLDAARQCGEQIYQFLALGYLAWALNQLGETSEAVQHYELAEGIAQAMGGRLVLSHLFDAVHAEILLSRDQLDAAIARAEALSRTGRAEETCNSLGSTERTWALALHRLGRASFAEVDHHMEASIQAYAVGSLALDVAQTRLAWAKVCYQRGELAQAQLLLDQAKLQFMASGTPYSLFQARQLALSWEGGRAKGSSM